MSVWVFAGLALAGVWGGVMAVFARPLLARWREPVLRHPVLVIESDDWGAGPLEQADVLKRLHTLLHAAPDATGRPGLMTLGVVMEVPDGGRMAADADARYHACLLSDARLTDIRMAMHEGIEAGVFAPQLHGQAHYWPPAVMAAARRDPRVADWLVSPTPARTEALPSPLQSRWVDASSLPSVPLAAEGVHEAVKNEAGHFMALFGSAPVVAVATTFIWTDAVESAWREAGVETVITPGQRATCRDAAGMPGGVDRSMLTGEISPAGLTYLVRDVYFEPALGHPPGRLADGLAARTRQGRACLVETHRFNFLDAPEVSFPALAEALATARARCPDLRYLAPAELARAIRRRDPAWIEPRLPVRIAAWRARLAEIPRFARVARLVGLGWVLA